jgi:hypothetical protein
MTGVCHLLTASSLSLSWFILQPWICDIFLQNNGWLSTDYMMPYPTDITLHYCWCENLKFHIDWDMHWSQDNKLQQVYPCTVEKMYNAKNICISMSGDKIFHKYVQSSIKATSWKPQFRKILILHHPPFPPPPPPPLGVLGLQTVQGAVGEHTYY